MAKERPYLIYAYPFDITSGGNIALHALCERLIALGHRAALWPSDKPGPLLATALSKPRFLAGHAKRELLRTLRGEKRFPVRFGDARLPEGRRADLTDAIMVYPEVVAGNPAGASQIVRWFLHRPGYHNGIVDYGPDEQYFFYQDAFNDPALNPEPDNRLTVSWLNPVYRQTNFGDRSGTCYLLRKGADRASDVDRTSALIIDGLSHDEKAAVFNRCEYLISYDPYSMYSVFAAMCGCVPIIVPEPGVSRTQWFPNEADRLGLAYGWEDVDVARSTQAALLGKLRAQQAAEDEMVRRFVAKTQARFRPLP